MIWICVQLTLISTANYANLTENVIRQVEADTHEEAVEKFKKGTESHECMEWLGKVECIALSNLTRID